MATTQLPTPSAATVTTWSLDPAHTSLEFSAKHMMITTVRGVLSDAKGTITIDEDNPERSHADVEIVTASIDTNVGQRDEHLRSADFLDVEHHPTITFKSTRIDGAARKDGDQFRVTGDLTIRGTTKAITLDCTYEGRGKDPWGGERISFSARTTVDRREWKLLWNQTLETGGLLVSNDIKIRIEVQAVRQSG